MGLLISDLASYPYSIAAGTCVNGILTASPEETAHSIIKQSGVRGGKLTTALQNLITEPAHKERIANLKEQLRRHLHNSNDPQLVKFTRQA